MAVGLLTFCTQMHEHNKQYDLKSGNAIKWANIVTLQKFFLCRVEPFVPNIDRLSFLS